MAADTLAHRRPQLRPAPPALTTEGCVVTESGHPPHLHTYHQFLYAPLGRVEVSALEASWSVELTSGLWIPAGVPHSSRCSWDAVVVTEAFDADRFDLPYHRPTPSASPMGRKRCC
ncbi:hypothetical protein [Streptomyces sp. A0592]|uniref:hypothetical protein n=1 Tax=Streptomyces sp. A0592 TaxID=2563099 RepID=UPI00109E59CA|nr:hypothetical protein [Streptomyces sp. A0592]THA80076.1 hypothetical protein E6U81_30185 [Streptomyces sp. A0592]